MKLRGDNKVKGDGTFHEVKEEHNKVKEKLFTAICWIMIRMQFLLFTLYFLTDSVKKGYIYIYMYIYIYIYVTRVQWICAVLLNSASQQWIYI